MHLPDGFLDAKTAVITSGLALGGLTIALRTLRKTLPANRIPLIGLLSAFLFSAQMINFPIAGGTSGHLLGASLAAIILGPSAAVLVLSSVLIMQCLLFADGGVSALGANIFNMGIVATLSSYVVYASLTRFSKTSLYFRIFCAAVASWISIVAASITCAVELTLSGTVPWGLVFPAMTGIHLLIGIGEAAITACVLLAIARTRKELILDTGSLGGATTYRELAGYGMVLSGAVLYFLYPYADSNPDGLEKVAESLGFLKPDLAEGLVSANSLTGIVGMAIVCTFAISITVIVTSRRSRIDKPAAG